MLRTPFGLAAQLPVVTLDPALEQLLHQSMRSDSGDGFAFEPGMAERFLRSLQEVAQAQELKGEAAVLLVSPALRAGLANWLRNSIAHLHVLSYQEVPDTRQIKIVATLGDERAPRIE